MDLMYTLLGIQKIFGQIVADESEAKMKSFSLDHPKHCYFIQPQRAATGSLKAIDYSAITATLGHRDLLNFDHHGQPIRERQATAFMFKLTCSKCKKKLNAPQTAAGKRVRCPGCGNILDVPMTPVTKPSTHAAFTPPPMPAPTPQPLPVSDPFGDSPLDPSMDDDFLSQLGGASSPSSMDDLFGELPPPNSTPVITHAPQRLPTARSLGPQQTAARPPVSQTFVSDPRLTATQPSSGNESVKPITEPQVRQAFQGELPPHQKRKAYDRSVAFVAAIMVALPAIYISIILISIVLWFGYTFYLFPKLAYYTLALRRLAPFVILLEFAPIPATLLMILFMIKPVFFWRRESIPKRVIPRETEPVLFALVEELSKRCNAPMPSQIEVSCSVNAGASLKTLFGKEVHLEIGAPLIASLSAKQLTGVLAHEFGHFAQGGGMRATALIRFVNGWFAKVVYQRDFMDDMLEGATDESESIFSAIWGLSTVFVMISRGILWCLMMIGHRVSCVLMHQMEYDADQYETRVCGSKTFRETSREMRVLNVAFGETVQGLREMMRKGKLPDDLPRMIIYHRNGLDFHRIQKLHTSAEKAPTVWHETHPSDGDRLEQALSFNHPGIFTIEAPARALFRNFPTICRSVTRDFYNEAFDGVVPDDVYVPTDQMLRTVSTSR